MSKRRPRLIDYRRRWLPQTRTGRTEALLVVFILLLPLLAANRATLDRFGGYFLLAIFALSVDLIWGYGGMFTFGHAAFFGGGGYLVGMLTTRDAWLLPLRLIRQLSVLLTLLLQAFAHTSRDPGMHGNSLRSFR